MTYRDDTGHVDQMLLYRDHARGLGVDKPSRAYALDGDPHLFRLAAEALRIRMAARFDPMLAVTTSDLEPLPHQIKAVYGELLPRTPLRFLLADDPGAGQRSWRGCTSRSSCSAACWDNAAAESFFATLKNEMYYQHVFPTRARARFAVAEYIEVFYNRKRLHSTLGYRTPAEVLAQHQRRSPVVA